MHQETWVHKHLQACTFVFDPGWRRHRREWCIHQLFAGRFQDDGAYHKWRVHLWCGDEVYWKRNISVNALKIESLLESRIGDTSVLRESVRPPSRRSRTALLRRLRRGTDVDVLRLLSGKPAFAATCAPSNNNIIVWRMRTTIPLVLISFT